MKFFSLQWIKTHPLGTFFSALSILILLIFALSSFIVQFTIVWWFEQQGAQVKLDDVKLSIFQSRLELKDLESSQNEQHLNLDSLIIDWQWFPLFDHQLVLDEVIIDGLELTASGEQGALIQLGSIAPQTDSSQLEQNTESQETPSQWTILLSKIDFSIKTLCYQDSQLFNEQVAPYFSGSSELKNLCHTMTLHWNGSVKLDIAETIQQKIDGDLLMENMSTHLDDMTVFETQKLSLNALKLTNDGLNLEQLIWNNLALGNSGKQDTSENIHAKYAMLLEQFTLENVAVQFNPLSVGIDQIGAKKLEALTQSKIQTLNKIANISNLDINKLEHSPDHTKIQHFGIEQLDAFENIFVSQDDKNTVRKYLLGFNRFTIEELETTPENIRIKSLKNSGPYADLAMNKNGEFNLSSWLPESSDSKAQEVQSKDEEVPAPAVEIAEVLISDSGTISFIDYSTRAKKPYVIENLHLSVTGFNTKGQVFENQLAATLNQTGEINVTGSGKWQGKLNELTLNSTVKGLNLAPFSIYSERFIGYRVDQGQLNTNLEFQLNNDKLNSEVELTLIKLELGDLQEHEHNELNADLGVPLPMALSLLKDSDNVIELSIPISGDANSPDFSVADVVSTVTLKAIKNAIILQYSPFGLLTLAGGVIDLATGLSFEPIAFTAKSSTLTDEAKASLSKLAELLKQKPQITLILCGQSVFNDLSLSEPKDKQDASAPGTKLTPEQIEALIELAEKRQSSVIQELTQEHGIAKERLIACNVKLDNLDKALPSVKVSI